MKELIQSTMMMRRASIQPKTARILTTRVKELKLMSPGMTMKTCRVMKAFLQVNHLWTSLSLLLQMNSPRRRTTRASLPANLLWSSQNPLINQLRHLKPILQ